jgi:hypothetical protein
MIFLLDYPILFRHLFFLFLFAVPLLNSLSSEFNSLYVLTVIFLGIAYSNISKWFLFLICSSVLIIRQIVYQDYDHPISFLICLFVYLSVTFISSEVTKQFFK